MWISRDSLSFIKFDKNIIININYKMLLWHSVKNGHYKVALPLVSAWYHNLKRGVIFSPSSSNLVLQKVSGLSWMNTNKFCKQPFHACEVTLHKQIDKYIVCRYASALNFEEELLS